MIEIVFSDSACGSLKMAQRYGEGRYSCGVCGVGIIHADGSKATKMELRAAQREAKERARRSWESAVPMGGNPADIYGFPLMLSVGDISEDAPGGKRKETLERLFDIYPNGEGRRAVQELLEKAEENQKTVRERAEAGEGLRIWYSNQPDEMCGLCWFMERLRQWDAQGGQVSIVMLPEWEADENGNIVRHSGWHEIPPGKWHRYLALEQPATPVFQTSCAFRWRELCAENAPLRAVLNGILVSAPETLYDGFLLREIAAESGEFKEARVIGQVLGKYQLGIADSWLAFRIEKMIRAGALEVVSPAAENAPAYRRILKTHAQRP